MLSFVKCEEPASLPRTLAISLDCHDCYHRLLWGYWRLNSGLLSSRSRSWLPLLRTLVCSLSISAVVELLHLANG